MDAERSEALELLARPGWAWRLAHALARDEAEAEDALGEARLAALRGPIAKSGSASLRGWVATVVRNALRQGRRSEARRGERERAVARTEALAPTQRLVEREEARRKVVEALLALPEPYRAALIAHHYDGLSPSAIAAREGVPPSTVRNRLLRGRELLRRELARADGREPREWLAAVAPLLVRPESVGSLFAGGLVVGTKVAWTVGASVAIAVLGALWWWNGNAASPDAQPARGVQPVAVLQASEADDSTEAAVAFAAPATDVQRDAVAVDVAASADEVLVRVVDEAGNALPGAMVSWMTSADMKGYWGRRYGDAPLDLEDWLVENGSSAPADAAGETRLPTSASGLSLCARAGERWGQAFAAVGDTGPIVVTLEPSRDLEVEVVDGSGAPVEGAPVGLFMHSAIGGHVIAWRARTDAVGRATIHKLEHAMRNGSNPGDLPFVGFIGPVGSEQVPVDLSDRSGAPMQLVMPASGSLRVRLSAHGVPAFPEWTWVHVSELAPDRAPGEFVRGERHSLSVRVEGEAQGAEVLWTHVALGRDFEVDAQSGDLLQPASVRIRGPERADEERLVELELTPVESRILVRLVDASGAPLKFPFVSMHLSDLEPQGMPREVLTRGSSDADGRVLLAVPSELRGRPCHWRLSAFERNDQPLAAVARTIVPPVEGELDLGDVQLGAPPTFVAGMVVDANGAPKPQVQVSVARWTRMGGEGATEAWNWASGIDSKSTDTQGRFLIHGDPPPGRFAIAARANDFGFGPFVPFERGATDVVLRAAQAGALAGRLLIPDGVDSSRLRVTVEPQGQSLGHRQPVLAPRTDGTFEFDGLEVGPHVLRVRRVWDDGSTSLATVDGVRVSEGTASRDPRLDPLDLRGVLHALEFEFVDAGGRPVPRGHVGVRPHGESSPVVRVGFEDGRVRLSGAGASSDLDVVAPGFRTAHVEAARGATRVVLEPGFAARVHLPPPVEFPRSGVTMRLGFWHANQPRGPGQPVFDAQGRSSQYWGGTPLVEVVLADERELDVVLPESGEWSVAWVVSASEPDGSSSNWGVRAPMAGSSFVAPDDGAPVEVWLAPPDPDDLARVLDLVAR